MQDESRVRVQGATAYPVSAASARVRIANHVPFLKDLGVDLHYAPTLSADEYSLLVSAAKPRRKGAVIARSVQRAVALRDPGALFLVHRLLLMTPLPMVDPPRRLDVYDFDDALNIGSAAEANRRFQWTKQEGRRAVACMSRARLVIAANAHLAGNARTYARHVEVVPSCVDPSAQPIAAHTQRERVHIGWIGSHTTVAYLRPLLPTIQRMVARGAPVKLIVVGGDTGLRNDWVEHRTWSPETAAADLADFDIGVMPLPDTEWTRGKSGYKLLQYFAAAVPGVASPVGINAELVADGRGLAAVTDEQWESALSELIDDPDARRERGAIARRFVEERYSYQRWAPELAALFRSLC